MVRGSPPDLAAIATALRALIIELDAEVVEVAWSRQRIAGYGVGPRKMSEHYAYIAPQKRHVNLGLNRGALVPDPSGLLEGTGRAMRHVKVRSEAEVHRPELRAILVAAREERVSALAWGT